MTTITNERLGELHGYLKVCGSLVGMGSAWDELADALCELAALRASQPSEETKATVIDALHATVIDALYELLVGSNDRAAALTELERKGWK